MDPNPGSKDSKCGSLKKLSCSTDSDERQFLPFLSELMAVNACSYGHNAWGVIKPGVPNIQTTKDSGLLGTTPPSRR